MRRERSKSDMSLFENRLDKAALAFPKSESSKSLDKTLAAAIGDNPSSDEKSLKSIPKKNDVSWIWRWGYLPVKSAPAAITDLPHSSYSLSQAESKDASMPLTPRLASSEMRETADDDKSPLVSSPLLSPGARRAIKDENVTNFTKSPPRALFSLNDVAVEKEHESQIFRNEEGSLFLNENDHMDFLAPSKSDRCDYSAEYRIGLDDSAHKKEENDVELALSTSHRFSALSKCGHLLNLSPSMAAARLDFPTTSEKLLELLYAHRLTSADFVLLENMSLDDDQSVVVIVDDFLLTLDVANILFATVGLDAHGNQESEGSVDILHVDEQSIEQAIEQYYSGNNGEEQQKLVLPAWVGKRISTWTSVDERMGRHQSHAYDEECFEEAPNTSFEHRHILTSPADKEFSTPMSSLKEEMFGGSHRDGLVYMNSSGKINALDFDSWKNSALGWRESFADLMQAYKYQTHVHSSTRSNDDLAGILAAATSRDNSHHKPSRDSCNSPDDDYFFRSHDEEDLLHPPHITPFKTPQEAQYGDEAMEEATSSSVADSIELEQQRDVQGIHGDLVSKVDFESASKNESSLNVSSRMDRMSTIVEEEQEGETDGDHLSLQDIALEDISPEPAGGDFYDSDTDSYMSLSLEDGESGQDDRNMDDKDKVRRPRYRRYRYRKVLVPSKEQLELLGLVDGENEISFEVEDCPPVVAQAYVWPADAKIVVADLEGVVINSSKPVANNVWSSFLGASTPKTSVVEETVKLLNDVETRGFKVLFFSQSTNVGHSKDYLNKFAVGGLKLPPAPIFKSPDSLIQAFGASRTDVFKASALRGLRGLFPSYNNPYHAAFVSKTKDVVAFQRNNFPEGRIFVVDEKLHVRTSNRTNAMPLKEFVEMAREIFPDQIRKSNFYFTLCRVLCYLIFFSACFIFISKQIRWNESRQTFEISRR